MRRCLGNSCKAFDFSRGLFTILSFVVLSQGMKSLPLGTAYAVWTGIGAVGAALVGIVVLGESATLMRVPRIPFIVVRILLLKLAAHRSAPTKRKPPPRCRDGGESERGEDGALGPDSSLMPERDQSFILKVLQSMCLAM